MEEFNLIAIRTFDLIFAVFAYVQPIWSMVFFSIVTAILLLLVFRWTSNQAAIEACKQTIKARLLEIRIFKDHLGIQLSAIRGVMVANLKYLRYGLFPMLVVIFPVGLLLAHLNLWYGYRALRPGESCVVRVELTDGQLSNLSRVNLSSNSGLSVATAAVRIPETREVDWGLRVDEPGEHILAVQFDNVVFEKEVAASGSRLVRICPVTVSGSFWESLLYPSEMQLPPESGLRRVQVTYPERRWDLLGWQTHWLVPFFLLSLLAAFLLKDFLGVQI